MYVDFTDLSKACPKDSLSLPRIDQLVDSTTGHKLLSFMDAFFGYNQILMDERRSREDLFRHQPRVILLQSYSLWIEEHKSHISKMGEPHVLSPYWKECRGVCR